MKIVEQDVKILTLPGDIRLSILNCEEAARTCYNSVDRRKGDLLSAIKFLSSLLRMGHFSVIEHCSITVKFTTNIGIQRELFRHRIAAFSERSTRYCNFSSSRYSNGIEFCFPGFNDLPVGSKVLYEELFQQVEATYNSLISSGQRAEFARHVLPLSTKTEFIMTTNLREWIHILKLRSTVFDSGNKAPHPEVVQLMGKFYSQLISIIPELDELFKYNKSGQ